MCTLSESRRRELGRQHLESAETWLRAIIHYQLLRAYGADYFSASAADKGNIINADIRRRALARAAKDPQRFPRLIDATEFGDVIAIALNPELYPRHFRAAFQEAYPDGANEARTFLNRLKAHRNKLAHAGTCSMRELEQCVCYSNDLIDALKSFFWSQNVQRQFNVPTFVRVVDSKGNDFRIGIVEDDRTHFIDVRSSGRGDLYPKETISVEVEVDQSFDGWKVEWMTFKGDRGEGASMSLLIEPRHVGAEFDIRFVVTSPESWHRLTSGHDDLLDLRYRVLPPIS
jgi:hypothetical protein